MSSGEHCFSTISLHISLNGQLAKGMVPDDVIRGCVWVASIVTRADLLQVASPSSSEAERDMAIVCAMGDPHLTSSHCTL